MSAVICQQFPVITLEPPGVMKYEQFPSLPMLPKAVRVE